MKQFIMNCIHRLKHGLAFYVECRFREALAFCLMLLVVLCGNVSTPCLVASDVPSTAPSPSDTVSNISASDASTGTSVAMETSAEGLTLPGPLLSATEHPWGRFRPSSWTRTQTVTLTRNVEKTTRSISETKTTLLSVEQDGVTLEESSVVDFGSRQVRTAPAVKRYDFFQEPILDEVRISSDKPEKLIVDHLIIPCEKRVYRYTTPSGRHKTTIWYSTQIYPYIFRIERIHRSDSAVLSRSTTEVLKSSAFHFRKSKDGIYRLQTIRKSGNVTTITETSCSRHVPGGVTKETSRELDQSGREIRFVETRLVNYHCQSGETSSEPDFSIQSVAEPILIYEKSRLRWKTSPKGTLSQ